MGRKPRDLPTPLPPMSSFAAAWTKRTWCDGCSARALVHVTEEDFGIAVVEVQDAGTAVIAFASGGAAEIGRGLDTQARTGVPFGTQWTRAIVAAVARFEAHAQRIAAAACRSNPARFAPE